MTHLQKLPKNLGDLGKLIVAKGFKKLPKFQKSPNLVTLPATLPRYLSCHNIQSDFVSFTTFLASRSVYLLFISLYTLSIHLCPSLSLSLCLFSRPNLKTFVNLNDFLMSFFRSSLRPRRLQTFQNA